MEKKEYIGRPGAVELIKNTRFGAEFVEKNEYFSYSNKASESMNCDEIDDDLMFTLEYAVMHYKELPAAQRRQWRKLKNAQVEVASEMWYNFTLSRLLGAVDEYCTSKARRLVPVVWELYSLFMLIRGGRISKTKMAIVERSLAKMDAQIMSLGQGRKTTKRQRIMHILISLFQYIPHFINNDIEWVKHCSTAERDLSDMWEFVQSAHLFELLDNATRAMIGLTAYDILLYMGSNDKYASKAINLCDFSLKLMEGNIMIEKENIANLYLIGAYYYDYTGQSRTCLNYLRNATEFLEEERTQELRLSEIIYAIQKEVDGDMEQRDNHWEIPITKCKDELLFLPKRKLLS